MNIIELAKEAGLLADDGEVWLSPYQEAMERFAALVRAEALEEAAGWVEKLGALNTATPQNIAAAIRGLK
jgi:hypothetical protein